MKRIPLIAGNWKMNNTIGEAVVLAQEISNLAERYWKNEVNIAVCPPFVDLNSVRNVFEFDHVEIGVGAQNVYWEKSGAFTGEISVPMLAEIGCAWCIVGHSERRELFDETNEDVNKKVKALIAGRIKPIVCVGESLAVRDEESYIEFVTAQVDAAFAGVESEQARNAVIAYEPIWAIGTGRTATPEQAEEVCAAIRAKVRDLYDDSIADGMRILYGGSMNEGNAELLLEEEDIDGGLIGGASLNATSFINIVKTAMK